MEIIFLHHPEQAQGSSQWSGKVPLRGLPRARAEDSGGRVGGNRHTHLVLRKVYLKKTHTHTHTVGEESNNTTFMKANKCREGRVMASSNMPWAELLPLCNENV